jgi:hypothetical protein
MKAVAIVGEEMEERYDGGDADENSEVGLAGRGGRGLGVQGLF